MSLRSGVRLGPYEVIEPIGRGGMGEVYRARDTRLGRDVAVKVLPDSTAAVPGMLERFEYEARAVAALNHPNILALHDVGAASGISYAVTELLDGETLADRLARSGAMPARKALDMAVQLAHGVAAAHGRYVVHRDLKPDNIFLTADGRLKILDFGLAVQDASSSAAQIAETRFATQSGVLIGTPGYMSPEQVRGEPATVRSDIFSFGLVVYEALTGANPFRRDTAPETMTAILRDQPELLSAVPGLPPAAARLIERCLEKRAEDRPESMRDLALFLEALAGENNRETGIPDQSVGNVRRLALRSLAAVCALIVLLTLGMWGFVRATAGGAAGAAMSDALKRAEGVVLGAHQARLDRLRTSARLVASFPNLTALLDTKNAPTIRDYLQTYQQRNPGTPLLVALGPDGYALARTDDATNATPEHGKEWLSALAASGGAGVILIDGRPHHAAVSPAEAGSTIFGSVLAAAPVDDSFAQSLRDATEGDAVLLTAHGVAGTSLLSGQVPWKSIDDFRAVAGSNGSLHDLNIGRAHFAAREVLLTHEPPVSAVILASHDEAAGPYRNLQNGILAIGTIATLLVLVGGLAAIRRWMP